MSGLFKKIFGKKSEEKTLDDLVEDTILGIIERGNFQLSYDINFDDDKGTVDVDLFGEDEDLLKEKEGQLLDSIQLFLTRVIQHNMPDSKINIEVDSDGYRESANNELIKLADKLKGIAIKKQKSVYFRALPPKDRKLIHQHLAEDGRVNSQSIGDGLFKKIKIFPKKEDVQRAQQP